MSKASTSIQHKPDKPWYQRDITWLDSYANRWLLVLLSGTLGTVFMLIYDPLDIAEIKVLAWIGRFLTFKASAFVGAATVAFAQFGLRRAFGVKTYKVGTLILWIAFEMLLITIVIYWIYREGVTPAWQEFFLVMWYAVGIALPPYLLACLIIMIKEERSVKQQGLNDLSKFEKTTNTNLTEYLTIIDAKGNEPLTVKTAFLLCIEAKNNYVNVFYLEDEEVKTKLIRNNLKNLDQELADTGVIRVHRSHMINLPNISKVERKGNKVTLTMTHLSNRIIPVSNSYRESLEAALSSTKGD